MLSRTFKIDKEIQLDSIVQKLEFMGIGAEVKMEQTGNLTSLLIEKYFLRTGNVACCSVSIYSHSPVDHDVIVMSGGSSQGMIIKFSWGADTSFINDVCTILEAACE